MTNTPSTLDDELRSAYDAAGQSWGAGPSRLYDRMADELVGAAGVRLDGLVALDAGAGAGAATRALQARGALVIAADLSWGMLRTKAFDRPSSVVADIRRLPFRAGFADLAVAAFVINHLPEPADALRELRRVTRPGGTVLASTYAGTHPHPAKDRIEEVSVQFGYRRPAWYDEFKNDAEARTSTTGLLGAVAEAAGLVDVDVRLVDVDLGRLSADELVGWRLGMAHFAPFLAGLPADVRTALVAAAVDAVSSGMPPVVMPVNVLRARAT